jgi:hypothetical protein
VNDYQSDGDMEEEEAPIEGAEEDWWADEDGARSGPGVRSSSPSADDTDQ